MRVIHVGEGPYDKASGWEEYVKKRQRAEEHAELRGLLLGPDAPHLGLWEPGGSLTPLEEGRTQGIVIPPSGRELGPRVPAWRVMGTCTGARRAARRWRMRRRSRVETEKGDRP